MLLRKSEYNNIDITGRIDEICDLGITSKSRKLSVSKFPRL